MDLTTAHEFELEPRAFFSVKCNCASCEFYVKRRPHIIRLFFVGFLVPVIWIYLFVILIYGLHFLEIEEVGDGSIYSSNILRESGQMVRKTKPMEIGDLHSKHRDTMKELALYCVLFNLMYVLLGFMIYAFGASDGRSASPGVS